MGWSGRVQAGPCCRGAGLLSAVPSGLCVTLASFRLEEILIMYTVRLRERLIVIRYTAQYGVYDPVMRKTKSNNM